MSKEISNFVMPKKPSGRFVQQYIDKLPFIRFSLTDEEDYNKISERLSEEYLWKVTNTGVTIEHTAKGFYKLLKNGAIQLYGDKHRTDVNPNQEHLDRLTPYLPKGIKLEIGKAI
jgi:hypothetical protein